MSANASPLGDYLESVTMLPAKMQQNFNTLAELDHRRNRLHEELDTQVAALQAAAPVASGQKRSRRSTVADGQLEAKLEPFLRACNQCGEEKVALAISTYDLVDKHIQRLDKSLKKFEEEVKQREAKERQPPKDASFLKAHPAAMAKAVGLGGKKGESHKAAKVGGHPTVVVPPPPPLVGLPGALPELRPLHGPEIDLPIDPNEPTYCICNRVSFGEMIACDNEMCKIEWFHFECVGLPREGHSGKGKWYCPECTAAKKRGR